jgi:hypothetical protein
VCDAWARRRRGVVWREDGLAAAWRSARGRSLWACCSQAPLHRPARPRAPQQQADA